jgi:hypothetical protein
MYRWPDRYGTEDSIPEGYPALASAMLDRPRKRSVQSGKRWLKTQLQPPEYTWADLKSLACNED